MLWLYYDYFMATTCLNCLHLRNLKKNCSIPIFSKICLFLLYPHGKIRWNGYGILQVRSFSGCGDAAKSKTVQNRSSVYSKESEYQFSVKLVNFYFPLRKSAKTVFAAFWQLLVRQYHILNCYRFWLCLF